MEIDTFIFSDAQRISQLEMKVALASRALDAGDIQAARQALSDTPDTTKYHQVIPLRQGQQPAKPVRRIRRR